MVGNSPLEYFFSWVKQIPTNSYFYWLLTTDCKISLSTHFICEDGGGEQALKVLVVYAGRKCLCQSLFVGNRIQSIKRKKSNMDPMPEMRSLQKSLEELEEEAFSRISRSHTVQNWPTKTAAASAIWSSWWRRKSRLQLLALIPHYTYPNTHQPSGPWLASQVPQC